MKGYFKYGGARLYYEMYGKGEPVLFIHGMLSDRDRLRDFADVVEKSGFSPVLIDLPLHGKSTGAFVTVRGLLEAISQMMSGLHLDSYHCVGHSLGSLIGSALARSNPRVKSFCALAPVVSDIRPAQFVFSNLIQSFSKGEFSYKALVKRMLRASTSPGVKGEKFEKFLERGLETSFSAVLHDVLLAFQINCGVNMKFMKQPLMVVAGKHDPLVSPDDIRKFLPESAEFIVLDKGHLCINPRDLGTGRSNKLVRFLKSSQKSS